jgi:hypothetical protein
VTLQRRELHLVDDRRSDEDLVAASRTGDDGALTELLQRYRSFAG